MALSHRDLEDLKPLLSDTVKQLLGFSEPTVVAAALNCVSTGYDMNKTIEQLSRILDRSQASTLAERVHHLYEDFRNSLKSVKKRRRDDGDDNLKKRKYLEDEIEMAELASLQQSLSKPKNTLPNLNPPGAMLTQDKIKEMMANAQKMILERKAQLQATMPLPPKMPVTIPVDPSKRAAELHAQIQARLSGMAGIMPPTVLPGQQNSAATQPPSMMPPLAGPSPLILNEEGKTIDAKTGEAVQLTLYTPTLKANIRAKRREQFKGLIDKPPEEISESKFFDGRLSLKGALRPKRGFKFHEKGKFEQQASRLRAKAQLERLQSEIAQAAKKTGIASAAKIATIAPKKEIKEGEIPDIEWWDTYIIKSNTYDVVPDSGDIDRVSYHGITNLVEHPTQIAPPVESKEEVSIPVYLTKKERKKLRRQNRREAEKELQEKIRLGLAPPMEPKVRMANLMRVLGTEAVQDPTKVEAHVRAQMAKRQRQHEEANAARKLTVEQRRDKKITKIKEDTSQGVQVSVYRVRDLSDPAIKFKVETNAKQLYMTGITIIYKDCNVVVVEGGPKQQRKFRRLMLHRIKWSESHRRVKESEDNDNDGTVDKTNKCVLVWEGMVKSRSFDEMKFKTCPTESFAWPSLLTVLSLAIGLIATMTLWSVLGGATNIQDAKPALDRDFTSRALNSSLHMAHEHDCEQLSRILDRSQASTLAERAYHLYEDFRNSLKSVKKLNLRKMPVTIPVDPSKRAAELHAQIQARLSGMAGIMPPTVLPGQQNSAATQPPSMMPPLAGYDVVPDSRNIDRVSCHGITNLVEHPPDSSAGIKRRSLYSCLPDQREKGKTTWKPKQGETEKELRRSVFGLTPPMRQKVVSSRESLEDSVCIVLNGQSLTEKSKVEDNDNDGTVDKTNKCVLVWEAFITDSLITCHRSYATMTL
ncbi:U4/U6 small nuclear ribonucleoprotein Prp3, partial [Bulinus truncatus]